MLGLPGLPGRFIANDAVAADRVAVEQQLAVLDLLERRAQKPVRQHLTRAHVAEFLKRLSGLQVAGVAHHRLNLFERDLQALETGNRIFHGLRLQPLSRGRSTCPPRPQRRRPALG
jgi:hypothetical protein